MIEPRSSEDVQRMVSAHTQRIYELERSLEGAIIILGLVAAFTYYIAVQTIWKEPNVNP